METIVDVSQLAGVSTSTVSHVLNATRPVREDTRSRVQAAIRATGYRRDSVARAMRRSRTDSIGLVVSDVTSCGCRD
ncbi:LacI family DNA-binding transcriptional regulator [Streptomyces xantholiticus]|uniref:LacI family DNA-binding transcriptional regulator n=1 Tax=Streptomyces xantholiticus TaxID=68285 RepID=A0ABV1UNF7_9ACTN